VEGQKKKKVNTIFCLFGKWKRTPSNVFGCRQNHHDRNTEAKDSLNPSCIQLGDVHSWPSFSDTRVERDLDGVLRSTTVHSPARGRWLSSGCSCTRRGRWRPGRECRRARPLRCPRASRFALPSPRLAPPPLRSPLDYSHFTRKSCARMSDEEEDDDDDQEDDEDEGKRAIKY